jgi:hypothetical protein
MSAEARVAAQAGGITPLDYMLQVLRAPESDAAARIDAAKAAAPYVHPKLSAIEHSGEIDHHVHDDARTVIAGLLSELAGGGAPPKA